MATPIDELFVRLGVKTDRGSFGQARGAVSGLRRTVVRAAAAIGGVLSARAIGRVVSGVIEIGDSIDKTSSKLGVAADALQELRFAGELAGVSTRNVDLAMQRFIRRSAEAAQGTGEAKDALAEMGIALRDANGQVRSGDDLLGDVADAFARTSNDADRLRLAFKLFDSEGVAMVNVLRGGRAALEGTRAEARALGGVMDEELVRSTVQLKDDFTRLQFAARGIKFTIVRELGPAIQRTATATIAWVKANGRLLGQRVARALETISVVAKGMGQALVAIKDALLALLSPLGEFARAALLLVGVGLAFAAVFGLVPTLILAAIALIGLAIGDVRRFAEGKDSVLGRAVESIRTWWNEFLTNPIEGEWWPVTVFRGLLRIVDLVRRAVGFVVDKVVGLRESAAEINAGFAGTPEGRRRRREQTASRLAIEAEHARRGGGESAALSMSVAPAPPVEINMSVEAAPGMSTEELASRVSESAEDAVRRGYRQAMSEFAVGASGP